MFASLALLFDLAKAFFLCGLLSFGGGYAMIPIVERELITARGWLTIGTFTEIIAVAEMTPGPIAVNTATFVGFRIAGVLGSIVSTVAVLCVPILVAGTFAVAFSRYSEAAPVRVIMRGIRPAACALLTAAAFTVARDITLDLRSLAIAAATAVALWRRVHPLLVIAGAAALGLLLY